MIDLKKQIESIIEDLVNDSSISRILLKAQTIAFSIKNETFSQWVKAEQNGYKDFKSVPEYRKVKCGVKANISIPFRGIITNMTVPVDAIEDKRIQEMLSHIIFMEPITQIEEIGKANNKNSLRMNVPAFTYGTINEFFPHGNIEDAWKYTNPSSALSIVSIVKSKLLDFFLNIEKEIDINVNFNVMANREKIQTIMNQTIKAGVVNTGNGSISIRQSEIVGGNKTTDIPNEICERIKSLLKQIETLENRIDDDEQDIAQYIFEIKEELESKMPKPAIIKRTLRALKTLETVATEKVIEHGLDQIISLL